MENEWTEIMQRMYRHLQTHVIDFFDTDGTHIKEVDFIHEEDGPETAVEVHDLWKLDVDHRWKFIGPCFVEIHDLEMN